MLTFLGPDRIFIIKNMNKIVGIYKITNPYGKIYIGQSRNITHRLRSYKIVGKWISEQKKIYNSLKKYGPENHIFEILEECSPEFLNEREIYWISYFNSVVNGLNLRSGGNGGGAHSKETIDKRIKYLTGRKQSKETIEKRTKKLKGLKRSEESRKNISNGKKGKPITWGDKIKISKNLNPYIPTAETKLKLRKNNCKPIKQFDKCGNYLKTFYSAKEAERQLGIKADNISQCLKGNSKSAGGFIWKYDLN